MRGSLRCPIHTYLDELNCGWVQQTQFRIVALSKSEVRLSDLLHKLMIVLRFGDLDLSQPGIMGREIRTKHNELAVIAIIIIAKVGSFFD